MSTGVIVLMSRMGIGATNGGDILKSLCLLVLAGLPLVSLVSPVPLVPLGVQPDSSEARFWQALRRSSQPYLLVFEEASKPLAPSFRKLLDEEGIADLGLANMTLGQRDGSLRTVIQRRFGLSAGTRWAVVNSKEECLASGQTMPNVDEFAQLLAEKGVQSPIRVLRAFVKTRPDHLESRIELLHLQKKRAEQRTRSALGLESSEPIEFHESAAPNERMMAIRLQRTSSSDAILIGHPKPVPIPPDKALDAEADLQIWGGYAQTFDQLLTGEDWVTGGLSFANAEAAVEVCSPLVKGLYKRKIKQVEAALERAPTNQRLWSVWIRMADAIGGQSIQAVVGGLVLLPGGSVSSWPAAVRKRLIEEARENMDWHYVADYLWAEYEVRGGGPRISVGMGPNDPMLQMIKDSVFGDEWDSLFDPLLEALLSMDDLGRADAIMNSLHERQQQGQWSEALMQKAIALAIRCGRQDIAKQWSTFLNKNYPGNGGA